MGKPLTQQLILAKTKTENLHSIRNLNLWGNDLEFCNNYLKDLTLLRAMPNIEVLSLSVNKIKTLKEFANCSKMTELYIRKNEILDLAEIYWLTHLKNLRVLWLSENPCADNESYRDIVIRALPNLVKLDNANITQAEKEKSLKIDLEQMLPPSHLKNEEEEPDEIAEEEKNKPQKKSMAAGIFGAKFAEELEDKPRKSSNNIPLPVNESSVTSKKYKSNKNLESTSRNENILCAVLALLKELDNEGLEFVKRDIERKLSNN